MNSKTMVVKFQGAVKPLAERAGFATVEAQGTVLSEPSSLPDSTAQLFSTIFMKDGRFWESGEIRFPKSGSLFFTTKDPGLIEPISDSVSRGTISWYVTKGTGDFDGATGIVTGNFTANAAGEFTDHQVLHLTY